MRITCCIYKDFVRQLKAFLPSFSHLCTCEMSPGWGHLIIWMDPSVGHLNGILALVGGNLNNNFQKSQMPGDCPGEGILKLRFDRYIIVTSDHLNKTLWAQLTAFEVTILKIALMVSSKIRWYYCSTANYQCSNFNIITSHLNMNTIAPQFDTRLNRCMIIVTCTECLYW